MADIMKFLDPEVDRKSFAQQKQEEYMARQEMKHSREVISTNVDIKSGLKFMRVLGVVLYVLSAIGVVASLVLSDEYRNGGIFIAAICGSIIPVSIGLLLGKAADIAEYISDKVK